MTQFTLPPLFDEAKNGNQCNSGNLPPNFVKFLKQKCIGYGEQGSPVYFEHTIELVGGLTKVVYGIHPSMSHGHKDFPTYQDTKPHIPRPQS